ncbi:MAG: adenylate/guanylate cyclase domain-containing protein [Mesorhizobium sp.]|nr:MAG: adenylate/guanylate cyclase domain-containing protein [Mesorhizobium sp.]
MADERVKRRLAAIAVADVVGYSRMMEADEAGTLAALKERRKAILEPIVRDRGGRIVKLMGDGVLMEFTSAVNAVEAAVELQAKMAEANQSVTEHRRILLRIGINLGDVIGEGSDIYGDGVNVAARLEALAEPGGVCVSAKVHEELRGKGNAAFEDMGEVELKNIVRPVRVYRVETSTGQVGGRAATTSAARPSIAVLPFDNLSGDPSQQYLSDGITEDITTELSRFKNLTVAARHASFHLARMGINPMQAARDLGANYVIEGSVRKAGERIRITAQLIDARTGNHVWAERYDRECHDIFAVQDEVVAAIVTTLEGRMVAAAALQARKRPTSNWTAYDFFLQGRELADANMEKEAVPLFSRATAIDPDFAHAHAWLAIALLARYWFDTDPRTLHEASLAAQRAMELDSNDPTVHHANGMVMVWLREYERAGVHFDRAVALNPADAQIRADRANWLRYAGRPEEALASIDDALKRTPFPPHWFWVIRAKILLELRRYGEVVAALDNMPKKDHPAWLTLAAAHDHLGHAALAANALAKARELRPSISSRELIAVNPYAHRDALKPLLDGLRNAGLPE